MRIFEPERLKLARQRRAKTKKVVAEYLHVSAQAVTGYESGIYNPTPEIVEKIGTFLGFPVEWFYAPDFGSVHPQSITFRARYSMTSHLRNQAFADSTISTGVISPAFRKKFNLPTLNLPNLSDETPETAAKIMRHQWELGNGPIKNMVHLLESKGIEVYWWDKANSNSLDAASLWRDAHPYVFLNLFKNAGCRGRFDAAHELGHLVLHRSESPIDLDSRQVEAEANQFAAEFLMPATQFRRECPKTPTISYFFDLKRRWQVAITAMIRRGKDTGVFSAWEYELACREIARLGYRTKEPEHLAIPRETSGLQPMLWERLANKGVYAEQFAKELHLSWDILVEAVPSAKDFRFVRPLTNSGSNSPRLRLLPSEKTEKEKPQEAQEIAPKPEQDGQQFKLFACK